MKIISLFQQTRIAVAVARAFGRTVNGYALVDHRPQRQLVTLERVVIP